jgi:hypothetical protein
MRGNSPELFIMPKANLDSRVQRMIEENWEDHEYYCNSDKEYRKDFIQDMERLFLMIETHTIHTVVHAVQVHLEDEIEEDKSELRTGINCLGETIDQLDIECLQEGIEGNQACVDVLKDTLNKLEEIALRDILEADSEVTVGV